MSETTRPPGRGGMPELTARDQDLYYAEKMIEYFGQEICYIPKWGSWCFYTGTHWERDSNYTVVGGYAQQTTRRLYAAAVAILDFERRQSEDSAVDLSNVQRAVGRAQASQNTHRFVAIYQAAQCLPEMRREPEDFDKHAWLLPCANGTLELKEGRLRKSSKADYLTRHIPIRYEPDAKAPKWEAFLAKVLPDPDVRGFIQRWFGYCLTGDVGERLFVVLYGGGANGKSVLLETMQRILGSYAVVMPPALLMARKTEAHPTELAGLAGARLAISSEVKEGVIFDESTVKRLTGNDTLTARKMREDFWSFQPTHKLMLAANHKPHVTDTSDSFWDRLALIPFNVRISEKDRDPHLKAKLLREEASGILSWAIHGLQDYLAHGMQLPSSARDAAKGYRMSEDMLGKFIAERLQLVPGARTQVTRINLELRAWATRTNIHPPSTRKLAERLRELGCEEHRTAANQGWLGVRLSDDQPDGAC